LAGECAPSPTPLNPAFEGTEAPDVELRLEILGGFGSGGSRQYTEPAQETERPGTTVETISPQGGKPGPRFVLQCKMFDIQASKIQAEARLVGNAVATNGPYQFAWQFDGSPVTTGVQVAATSSRVELVAATQQAGRLLVVRVTTGTGIVMEATTLVATPTLRKECTMMPKNNLFR
jgi:hypothetical protein